MNKSLVIVPYMPKGGVGKTTTAAHLGYALSEFGKTLVIDADPQGNLTNHLTQIEIFQEQDRTLVKYLNRESSFIDSLTEARPPNATFKGLYLLGNNSVNNQNMRDYISTKFPKTPTAFKTLIKTAVANDFTYIIIDPPAEFDIYSHYIIASCTHILPVIEPEKFGIEALFNLMHELSDIAEGHDTEFNANAAVINNYSNNTATHKYYLKQMKDSNPPPFKNLFIINNVKSIPFACAKSQLLQEYRPENQACKTFTDMAKYYRKELKL